jgi:ubiquinone/menaquinone biosynthesis C-methylase UbiE
LEDDILIGNEVMASNSIGFYYVWLSYLGKKFGLFDALWRSRRPLSAAELAKARKLNQHAVDCWCRAAASFDLVQRSSQGNYKMTAKSYEVLANDRSKNYFGSQFAYLALRSLDYRSFDELFKSGKAQDPNSAELARAFEEATRWDHTAFFDIYLPRKPSVRRLLDRGGNVLDIGCGSGRFAFRLSERFPRSRITGIDLERKSIDYGTKEARKVGIDSKVVFKVADAEKMSYDEEFDLAYCGEVLCMAKNKLKVVKRASRALKPGGFMIAVEGLLNARRSVSLLDRKLIQAMQLDFALHGSRFLERSELEGYLRKAGMGEIAFTHVGGGLWFVSARKTK